MSHNPTKFRVASLNLFNFLAPPNAFFESENIYSLKQWKQKQDWIQGQLMEAKPDIIGFQEVFSPNELKDLVQTSGYEYFVTVEKPGSRDGSEKGNHQDYLYKDYVYDKSIVALASRFPIVSAQAVVDSTVAKGNDSFMFSRAPLKVEIDVPGFGIVLCYVVHLKSQRSMFESPFNYAESYLSELSDSVLAQVQGRWASTMQRGQEASLIYADIVQEMLKQHRPVMLMGDLNDSLNSHALKPLLGSSEMDKLNNAFIKDLPLTMRRIIRRLGLQDAFLLQEAHESDQRKPTHYFANQGNVIDYILLSQDFDATHDHSVASVETFHVVDKHLINPVYSRDAECSDHAMVIVDIALRI